MPQQLTQRNTTHLSMSERYPISPRGKLLQDIGLESGGEDTDELLQGTYTHGTKHAYALMVSSEMTSFLQALKTPISKNRPPYSRTCFKYHP